MSEFAEFVSQQYLRLKSAYADKFPDEMGVQQSSMMISLIQSQYIHDVMENNNALPTNYYSALLDIITENTKESINLYRQSKQQEPIDWSAGKELLKEI